jgi:inner membrane protein
MPTVLTHAALPLIAAWGLGPSRVPPRLALVAAVVAVVPDLDVLSRFVGIPVESILGHRGASHSVAAALVVGMLAAAIPARPIGWPRRWWFLFLSALSHGSADMLTDGGKGIALFWPLTSDRMFFWFRPVEVSPIFLRGLENGKLWLVLASEMFWILLPVSILAILFRLGGQPHIDLSKGQS